MANAKDLALAETINNDRFPIEVDITEDVESGKIDKEDLSEAMGGKAELTRLKRQFKEAQAALDQAKMKETQMRTALNRRSELLSKKQTPKNDCDRKLMAMTEEKVIIIIYNWIYRI